MRSPRPTLSSVLAFAAGLVVIAVAADAAVAVFAAAWLLSCVLASGMLALAPPDRGMFLPVDDVDPMLVSALRQLGNRFGPLGVAAAAAQLTDPDVLVKLLTGQARRGGGPRDERA